MTRALRLGLATAIALVLGAGAYLQWFDGSAFGDRYERLTRFDFVVNTAFERTEVDADSRTEAEAAARGVVRVTFDGPDVTDEMTIIAFDDADAAHDAFVAVRSRTSPLPLPPGFWDWRHAFCSRTGPSYGCAVQWDEALIEGVAAGDSQADSDDVLDSAQGLLSAGVKNYDEMTRNLDRGVTPFVLSFIVSIALGLGLLLWTSIDPPHRAVPAEV